MKVELANDQFILKGQKHLTDRFVIKTPYNNIKNGMKKVDIIVVGNGKEIDRVGIKILGPNY